MTRAFYHRWPEAPHRVQAKLCFQVKPANRGAGDHCSLLFHPSKSHPRPRSPKSKPIDLILPQTPEHRLPGSVAPISPFPQANPQRARVVACRASPFFAACTILRGNGGRDPGAPRDGGQRTGGSGIDFIDDFRGPVSPRRANDASGQGG
jgi:hypothetical protein